MELFRRLPLLLLVVVSSALLATGATRDELYERAEADRVAGRYESAASGFTEVLRLEPRNGHTWVRRALCFHELHRYQEAMLDYCRAHAAFVLADETKVTRAVTLTNRASSAFGQGDFAGAFADAFSASKVDPTYAKAWMMIGDSWYAVGSLDQAQTFLAEALKLDPSIHKTYTTEGAASNGRGKVRPDDKINTDADFTAAGTAYSNKNYPEALAIYDRILATQPLNSAAWGNRGIMLQALERYADAVISHSRAAAVAGTAGEKMEFVARHFLNRLNCWLDLDDTDAAVVDGEIATRAYPDGSTGWQRLAAAWYAWGDLEKAQAAIAEAKKRDDSFEGDPMTEDGARVNRAKRLARAGNHDALRQLVEAAVKAPHDLFSDNPIRTAAIAILDELLKKNPGDVELFIFRAEAEDAPAGGFKNGTAKEAIVWIEKALAIDPDKGEALLVRGLFRLKVSGSDQALKDAGYADLDRAIQFGAANAEVYSWRGAHAMDQKDFSGALENYIKALEFSPEDLDLLRQRASTYEQLKQFPEAIADHDRLVELSPKKEAELANRADAYINAGDFTHALADFSAALALTPKNADLFLGRAQANRLSGNRNEALADLRQARVLDPQLPELAADGSNAEAIEALRHDLHRAMKQFSNAVDAVNDAELERVKAEKALARSQGRMRRLISGDDRTPEQIIEEVEKSEKDQVADAEDYRDRAHALIRLDRPDEALTALDQAITLDDSNANARDLRGRLYESRKDNDRAFTDYDRAVALASDNDDYHRDRGDIWWARKDFTQALADYEEAVKLDAKKDINWFKRGNAKLMLNRFADAIADYDKAIELNPKNEHAKKNREVAQGRLTTP